MPIQIIPKSEERQPFWLDFLFYFSLFLVIAAASSYFILGSLKNKAEKKYNDLVLQLSQTATPQETVLEKKLTETKKKIDNFSLLLNNRKYTSQVFPLIEKITHPRVAFSSFNLEVSSGKVSLNGVTDNFQTLAQQVAALKSEKFISGVELFGLSAAKDGKISFGVSFTLDQKIFNKNE
jgi:hypothetical protein